MKPFQRIGKRDKPVWLEEQEEEPSQRVRKRDKPVLKKICYIKVDCCSGEIVFRTMMYLLMKFSHRPNFQEILERFHCNSREFQIWRVVFV